MKIKSIFLIMMSFVFFSIVACGGSNGHSKAGADTVSTDGSTPSDPGAGTEGTDTSGGTTAADPTSGAGTTDPQAGAGATDTDSGSGVTDGSAGVDAPSGADGETDSAVSSSLVSVDLNVTVSDGLSGKPLAGSAVVITNALGITVFAGVSDSNGNLSLPVILDSDGGPYTVTISFSEYISQSVVLDKISDLSALNYVKLSEKYVALDFTTVIADAEGAPIAGAIVYVKDSLGNTVLLDGSGNALPFLQADANGSVLFDCKILSSLEALTISVSAVNYDVKLISAATPSAVKDALGSLIQLSKINSDALNVNNDTAGSGAFDYSTIKELSFALTVVDLYGNSVEGAKITVKDASGKEVATAVTLPDGKASFSGAIDKVNGYIVVSIEQESFVGSGDIKIDNYLDLESVIRTIALERRQVIVPDSDGDGFNDDVESAAGTDANDPQSPDTDGDGVPDFDFAGNTMGVDIAPYDAGIAFVSTASYTMAFEDQYPNVINTNGTDADFNDLVVKLTYNEYSGTDNKVRKVSISCKPLAAGAAYNNKFCVRLNGVDVVLIANSKETFGAAWSSSKSAWIGGYRNSKSGETYKDTAVITKVVTFAGVDKSVIGAMPYGPYVVPNLNLKDGINVNGYEIHLPFALTNYSGNVSEGTYFPWAVIVPDSWSWALEGVSISAAYLKFQSWYTSGGTSDADWYEYPVSEKVYSAK